jgi:peptide/nickel transport system ATP-binding protein
MAGGVPLVEMQDVRIDYRPRASGTHRTIVSGVDLSLAEGETIGIVGESGSGKSMLAKSLIRLLPRDVRATGRIAYRGLDVNALSERKVEGLRGSGISLLYQDPFTMLNPLLRCGDHIIEGLGRSRQRGQRAAQRQEAVRRLAEVGIDDPDVARRYPFQLSGGMRQRVALAAALARDPELLIADEPSTALDVTTQAQILALLRSVQAARGMGLILITHDLRVAFSVCARVYVLYAGRVMESAPARSLEREPLHPYSLGLLVSDPPVDRTLAQLPVIAGGVPAPDEVADVCAFSPRCSWVKSACTSGRPPLAEVGAGRHSACIRLAEIREELQIALGKALEEAHVPFAASSEIPDAVLRVRDLTKVFAGRHGRDVHALRGVSIEVGRRESVGVVGESGSGKTTLARCLVGLETATSGTIEVAGVSSGPGETSARQERRNLHKLVQIVFQDPYSSLDPKQSAGGAISETLRANGFPRRGVEARVRELFSQVGLPASYIRRLPSSLSGGERQRVAIARALAVDPKLIILDEPVSALDVSVQAQVLNLLSDLRRELGLSYLFITHDLAVVRQVVERIYVCHRGLVVESGLVDRVLEQPQHEYTKNLIASIPQSSRGPGDEHPEAAGLAGELDWDHEKEAN